MKLNKDTVQALAEAIAPFDTEEVRQAYRDGRFPRADKVRDLDKRYRWDLFHASKGRAVLDSHGAYSLGAIVRDGEVVDGDITDAHIDTALRRIVAPLGGGA